jgi:hypothetical protein
LKGGSILILKNVEKSVKQIDLYKLTEDAVALVTKLSANINSESNVSEYYSYIDNVIHYFSDRQVAILTLGRQQIDIIYSNRKQILKNADKINYPITLKKPNFKYYKLPMIDKIMYDDFITKWNFDSNDKLFMYANIYTPVYNGVTKKITNDEIKTVKDINNLYDKITDVVKINNSKELSDYLNNIIIPRDDLYNINKFIDSYIISLKDLKNRSVLDLGTEGTLNDKLIFAMKMIDIRSMYVKNIVNVLLDIYLVKINLCSYGGYNDSSTMINATSESVCNLMVNRSIYDESLVYLNEGFDQVLYDKIKKNEKDINNSNLDQIKNYIDKIFNSMKIHLDKYYRIDQLEYLDMFNITNYDDFAKDIDSIVDYKNYIETNLNYDYRRVTNYVFLDHRNDTNDRAILLNKIDKKDEILDVVTSNYNKIISYIEYLQNNKNDQIYSRLFNRYYNELPIYAKEEMDLITEYIGMNYDIHIDAYEGFGFDKKVSAKLYREVDNRYGHNVEIISLLERYVKLLNQYCDMNVMIPDNVNLRYTPSIYIDDKLFAYIIFFQKQAVTISMV